jgi:uncharacterized delta-60 repeat protein
MRIDRKHPVARVLALSMPFLVALVSQAAASPGDLDPTFGEYGSQGFAFGEAPGDSSVADLIGLQPSGLPILAGSLRNVFSGHDIYQVTDTYALARLNAGGQPDRDFAGGGLLLGNLGLGAVFSSTALADDGKIVVGGIGSDHNSFVVARLTADGALDPTFSGDGLASVALASTRFARAAHVAVLSDGSVILAGIDGSGSFDEKLVMMRFSADGTPDPSFGTGGQVTEPSEPMRAIADLEVDSQDRILLSSGSTRAFDHPPTSKLVIARYLPNGQVDPSFAGGESIRLDDESTPILSTQSAELTLDGDDRIYAQLGSLLTRFTAAGGKDTSFGTGGTLELPADIGVSSVLPANDGGLFLTGWADIYRDQQYLVTQIAVGRLQADGTPDSSFGSGGWARTFHDGPLADPSLVLLPTGELLLAAAGRSELLSRYELGAGAPADLDADGVADAADPCPGRAFAGTGCPSYRTGVKLSKFQRRSLGRRPGVFVKVRSANGCLAGRKLRIYERKSGRDRRIGSADLHGPSYGGITRLFVPIKVSFRGRIYGAAAELNDPRFGMCNEGRSKAIKPPRQSK